VEDIKDSIRLITAPIDFVYSLVSDDSHDMYKREYDKLSESDDDPVGHWLKKAHATGDTQGINEVVITLLAELHRKVDNLETIITNKPKDRIKLEHKKDIISISYEYFMTKEKIFKKDEIYYARVNMPTFPQREIPMFIKAVEEDLVYIDKIHERDIKDWDSYVASRERAMIREIRSSNDN
jgi:hypothetical protein